MYLKNNTTGKLQRMRFINCCMRPLTPFNRILSLSFTGALDTWTVNIVPKNLSKNGRYQSQSIMKCITKPFEQTFRLQVIFLNFFFL